MKKALLLVSILTISVFSTACINNFAVQELNNKAKVFMEQGDYTAAIERLKSSIDLDDTVFESHYNLAVAYTQAEDYLNAISAYEKAISLKSDFADAYYSLAVAQESLASAIKSGEYIVNETGNIVKAQDDLNQDTVSVEDTEDVELEKTLSPEAQKAENDMLTAALANYNKYLESAPEAGDAEDVKNKIKSIEDRLNAPSAPVKQINEE